MGAKKKGKKKKKEKDDGEKIPKEENPLFIYVPQ